MSKLYVAFTECDVCLAVKLVEKEDVVLAYGDVATSPCVNASVDYTFDLSSHVRTVRDIFAKISLSSGIDFNGFSNNFFECSIRPSLRYLHSLSKISQEKNIDTIVFSNKIKLSGGKVNYYMGEHESQGEFFYDRAVSLQRDIVDFCKKNNINVEYLGSRGSLSFVRYFLRDVSVYFYKFVLDLKQSFSRRESKAFTGNQVVLIIRTIVQFDFLYPLIKESNINLTILCGETARGNVYNYVESACTNHKHVSVYSLLGVSPYFVVCEYLRVLVKYIFSKKLIYSSCGFDIDITQAYKEMILMSGSLSLYKTCLRKSLIEYGGEGGGMFVTCEQKSPHAYVDAYVGNEKKYMTVHLMSCDQENNDLPFPVFGDLYVVDTLKRKKMFENEWSTSKEKIFYNGSIRLLTLSSDISESNEKSIYNYCYFSHVSEISQNLKVVSCLEEFCKKHKKNFCVKLHPRDSGGWIRSLDISRGAVFNHQDVLQDKLFSSFDIALSNPSAVMMDVLSRCKKIIFLDTLVKYRNMKYVYMDDEYQYVVRDIGRLTEFLERGVNINNVLSLRERVFGEDVKNLLSASDFFERLKHQIFLSSK